MGWWGEEEEWREGVGLWREEEEEEEGWEGRWGQWVG